MPRSVEGAESASDAEGARSGTGEVSERARDAAGGTGGPGGAPLQERQEWRRSLQRRAALLQHRRRLGR